MGGSSMGGVGRAGAGQLASNLDPKVCANVVYDDNAPDSFAQRATCNTCCNEAQFDSFGSYGGTCMCATPVPANTSVCPQSAPAACTACCNNAGFAAGNGTDTACFCWGTSALCPSADSADACRICCTEHGYLSWGGAPPCTCFQ